MFLENNWRHKIMTRHEQILSAVQKRFSSNDKHLVSKISTFIDGAKWADEHPDSNHTYTKQQLIDMGFAFTTNGDIVTPEQSNEDLKKYLQYKKRKFIEDACDWLVMNASDYAISTTGDDDDCVVSLDMVEDFRKAMER
jgi:hypothetical protein